MLKDYVKATGNLTVTLFDALGNVKEERFIPNLVVSVGKEWIAARMKDSGTPTQMTHMEIGEGTSSPVSGNTALETPFGTPARVALTVAGGSVAANVVTYSATFGAGVGTGAVTEAGIFNDDEDGTMLCRTTFPVVNKPADDTLAINWAITIN